MSRSSLKSVCGSIIVWLVAVSAAQCEDSNGPAFRVQFSKDVHAQPFTGRVYILFSRTHREPRTGPGWFRPELFVARDVKDLKPGQPLTFTGDEAAGMFAHPKPLAEMKLAGYRAQAVVRFNPYVRKIGTGAGNGYSQVITVPKAGENPNADPPLLTVDKLVAPPKFTETKWSKLLRVRSKLLSEFHNRDVFMQAAVILPASYYDQPDRRYPAIFTIPGFGGTHFGGLTGSPVTETNRQGVEFLRVVLDPSCPLGHHVFADSANNGPVGQALIDELIPAFNQKFRSVPKPTARFLTGHSSGGWSSLWLQVAYPEQFGGTWSTAPDPVDFRDFQRINLYRAGENMYVDADGQRRPLARSGGRVLLWYKGFADMEWTLGYGGQLHSFEAVFSPQGKDGRPRLLWDRKTGAINTDVAKTWEKYDIRLVLERNWKTLGPKLKGKLHVFMGDADTFYLDGATVLLKQSLEKLESDAVVEIHTGKDHSTLMTRQLRDRIRSEMTAAFLKAHPNGTVSSTVSSIVPAGAKVQELWNAGVFTEGVAVGPDGKMYFSDITADASPGRVMRFDPQTDKTTVYCANSGKSNGLMFDRKGRLMAACGSNYGKMALCQVMPNGKVNVVAERFQGKRFNSPNDLVIHPSGSIYFTDPRYRGHEPRELEHMSVYRYDTDGSVHRVTRDISKPNGVVVSPDGKTLYVAETDNGTTNIGDGKAFTQGRMTLNAFPIKADGSLGSKRVLVNFGEQKGTDGMTIDVDGNIYAAVRSAKRFGIVVYNPQGNERAYIPTKQLPTNCCFGRGKESKTLYITAGTGLFRIRLNAKGFHPATAPWTE